MSRVDQLRAELTVAELEADLVARKADPKAADAEVQYVKHKLRDARRRHRLMREAAPVEDSLGDATAQPATIKTRAGVKRPGGGA